jgi:hypothetical protein
MGSGFNRAITLLSYPTRGIYMSEEEKSESGEDSESISERVKELVDEILVREVNLDELTDEIWLDLSDIYYKYDDEAQKAAFRDVMSWICEKLQEDKWQSVYSRLYRAHREKESWE